MKKARASTESAGTGTLDKSTAIDLYDHLIHQLDRLSAIADLLSSATDELATGTLAGVGCLLKDLHLKMEEILTDAYERRSGRGSTQERER
jgi:hypothetical protein